MEFGRRQFLFEELIRQRQALTPAVRREATLDQVGHDDQAKLQPFRLVRGHHVHRVDGLIQRRDLFVRLRRLGGVEVLEVGGEVVIRVFVAVGRYQLGQLLDIGADLQALDRAREPLEVEIPGLLHHLVKEVVNPKPQRLPAEPPEVGGQAAGPVVLDLREQVEEPPAIVARPARPATRLHRVNRVAR